MADPQDDLEGFDFEDDDLEGLDFEEEAAAEAAPEIPAEETPTPEPDLMDRSELQTPFSEKSTWEKIKDVASDVPVRTLAQGATLGFGDEIEARARSAFGDDDYDTSLGRVRAKLAEEEEKLGPAGALAVEAAGSLPLMLVPGAGQARMAQLATKAPALARMMGVASKAPKLTRLGAEMAEGAVSALGHADDKTSTEALKGAGIGALGHGVGRAGGALVRGGRRLVAGSLGATPTQLRKLAEKHGGGSIEGLGQRMRELDLAGSSAEAIEQQAARKARELGPDISDVYKRADEAGGQVDLEAIRSRIRERMGEFSGVPDADVRNRIYDRALRNLGADEMTGTVDLSKAADTVPDALRHAKGPVQVHRQLQELQKKAKVPKFGSPRSEAYRDVVGAYRDVLQQSVDPADVGRLRDMNRAYSAVKDIGDVAGGEAARQSAQRAGGLYDLLGGGVAGGAYTASQGGDPKDMVTNVLVGAGLGRVARRYGKGALAKGADVAGRGLQSLSRMNPPGVLAGQSADDSKTQKARSTTDLVRNRIAASPMEFGVHGLTLSQAASKGDEEFKAAHYKLMLSSPEYREKLRELEEGETGE